MRAAPAMLQHIWVPAGSPALPYWFATTCLRGPAQADVRKSPAAQSTENPLHVSSLSPRVRLSLCMVRQAIGAALGVPGLVASDACHVTFNHSHFPTLKVAELPNLYDAASGNLDPAGQWCLFQYVKPCSPLWNT